MASKRGSRSSSVARRAGRGRGKNVSTGLAGRVTGTLGNGVEVVQERLGSIRDSVGGQVRSHPLLSAGIALGVGAAAGFAARHLLDEAIGEEPTVLGMPSGLGQVIAPVGGAVLGAFVPTLARQVRSRVTGRTNGRFRGWAMER